eukprot:1683626-Pleurochrysis_carterae.AAC.2
MVARSKILRGVAECSTRQCFQVGRFAYALKKCAMCVATAVASRGLCQVAADALPRLLRRPGESAASRRGL